MKDSLKLKVGDKFRVRMNIGEDKMNKEFCAGHWLAIVKITYWNEHSSFPSRYHVTWLQKDNPGKERPTSNNSGGFAISQKPETFYWLDEDWDECGNNSIASKSILSSGGLPDV